MIEGCRPDTSLLIRPVLFRGAKGSKKWQEANQTNDLWLRRRKQVEEHPGLDSDMVNGRHLIHFNNLWSRARDQRLVAEQPDDVVLTTDAEHTAYSMCAQQLFVSFLQQVLSRTKSLGGDNRVVYNGRPPAGPEDFSFVLRNSKADEIARIFEESGRGSEEDAYLCVIPEAERLGKIQAALHIASQAGEMAAVKSLLRDGARIDCVDFDGHNALQLAMKNEHADVVRLLLDHDSRVDQSPSENTSVDSSVPESPSLIDARRLLLGSQSEQQHIRPSLTND